MISSYCEPQMVCFDNDNNAIIPEVWALEALISLEENMVAGNLVHRDFEDEIKDFGDVVNCHRPAEFTPDRRNDGDEYNVQDAKTDLVRVPLDQWFSTSFKIKDGEASLAMKDLIQLHLVPAAENVARSVDRAVLGQIHQFLRDPSNRAGKLNGAVASADIHKVVIEARTALTRASAPDARSLILNPVTMGTMLGNDQFSRYDARGDNPPAIESAKLGRIYGFETYEAQNVNFVDLAAADTASPSATITAAAGATGALSVSGTWTPVAGTFVTLPGNDQPTYVTAGTANTNVTLNEALKYAVSSAAPKVYSKAVVDGNGNDYLAGHSKYIGLDGYASGKHPQVGQLIAFGTHGVDRMTYTIIGVKVTGSTASQVLLDRPLGVQVDDDDDAYPGPAGAMNWALCKDALALVTRPLAIATRAAQSGVASHRGLSLRITADYDIKFGHTQVNVEMLGGLAKLDERLAVALLG